MFDINKFNLIIIQKLKIFPNAKHQHVNKEIRTLPGKATNSVNFVLDQRHEDTGNQLNEHLTKIEVTHSFV